jgi:hypothetical protein
MICVQAAANWAAVIGASGSPTQLIVPPVLITAMFNRSLPAGLGAGERDFFLGDAMSGWKSAANARASPGHSLAFGSIVYFAVRIL